MSIFDWLNTSAFGFAQSVSNPLLTTVMAYWTESFYVVLLAVFAYLYFKKDKSTWPFVFALVLMFAISEVLKNIFREPRPCSIETFSWVGQVACESGYSFPSSHALSLTGLFLFLKNFKYVRAAYIIWLVIILFSRVYLGEHYLTDVLAGGVLSIILCYLVYKYESRINDIANKVLNTVLKRPTGT